MEGNVVENNSKLKAKTAFFCYLTLAAGLIGASILVAFVIFGLEINFQELNFPIALISLPVTESIILTITLLFAKNEDLSLRQLGLKKPKLKTIVILSFAAVILLLIAGSISLAGEVILGPDPEAETITEALLPRNWVQLIALLTIALVLVGPVEELAFRGFIQRGFENSFGTKIGLLVASVMFGILHGLNSLRSILPVTVVSLFLGYIWQKTDGNTIATAWVHGLYDAIAIAITFFAYA
jgi:membrane protease YdiL (CAAX protease family)